MTYLLVFIAGMMVGLAELLSRHRDYPWRAVTSVPSISYSLLNGALSVIALMVVAISPPAMLLVEGSGELDPVKTMIIVGFGAAAFFRSSFFKIRTPDGEISVGPGLVIDVFLRVIDDAVDRRLGVQRLDDVSVIMRRVSFRRAATTLPTYCFAALRRLPPETQQQFALQMRALSEAADIDDHSKAVSLGLALMALTGKPILARSVTHLGDRITDPDGG